MFKRGGLRILILSACAIVAILYLFQRHGAQVQQVQQRIYECLSDGDDDESGGRDTSHSKSRSRRNSDEEVTAGAGGPGRQSRQRPKVTVESEMARRRLQKMAWDLFYTVERLNTTGSGAIVEQVGGQIKE